MYGKILLFLSLLLATGCSRYAKEDKYDFSLKEMSLDSMSMKGKKISSLQIPIDFPVTELATMINRIMPEKLVDDTITFNDKGDFLTLKLFPIGDMLLNGYQNNLDASIPVLALVNINKSIAGIMVNKAVDFKLRIDLHTELSLDENYNLKAYCQIQKYRWIEEPETKLLGVKINLRNLVDKKLEENESAIEGVICEALNETVPIKKEVLAIWEILNQTHRVAKKPIDIWLTTAPLFFAARIDDKVKDTIRAIVTARSNIIITPLSGLNVHDAKKLPENSIVESQPGLSLHPSIIMPYDYANMIFQTQLGDQKIEYNGINALLTNLRIEKGEQYLRINADLEGDVVLDLTAQAQPFLTSKKQLIFNDLHFEAQGADAIVETAEWVSNTSVEDIIQKKTKIDLAHILDSLDVKIMKALNKSNLGSKIDLDLNFTNLQSDTLIYYDDRFEWSFDLDGKAHAFLNDQVVTKKIVIQ